MIILAYFIKLIEIVMAIWDVFSNQMNKPSISKEDLNRLLNVADINKTEAGTLLNFRNAPENTNNIPLQNAKYLSMELSLEHTKNNANNY